MPDIVHQFPVNAPADQIYAAITTPKGLDEWWTLKSDGQARIGATFNLFFGENYAWQAKVTQAVTARLFELELTKAEPDWERTRVRFEIEPGEGTCLVTFRHIGWGDESDHFRTSCFCWAMYLRIMKRHIEYGESVEYGQRLEV